MTITCNLQYFEDVILWRAFNGVEQGLFLKIGGLERKFYSVSKLFCERGWQGINVKPVGPYAGEFQNAQRDDATQIDSGDSDNDIALFEVLETNHRTGYRRTAVDQIQVEHPANVMMARGQPLNIILEGYKTRDIHWLKIGVEGIASQVIESWRPSKVRPWIVIVESAITTSLELTHEDWEAQLFTLGYQFVYFDGLNRFYVSNHHQELLKFLVAGLNDLDDFKQNLETNQIDSLNAEVKRLSSEIEKIGSIDSKLAADNARLAGANANFELEVTKLTRENIDLRKRLLQDASSINQLNDVYDSRSWKITAPLRSLSLHIGNTIRRMRGALFFILSSLVRDLAGYAILKKVVLIFLARFPELRSRLVGLKSRGECRISSDFQKQNHFKARRRHHLENRISEIKSDLENSGSRR